jgi:hypothetical protein
MHSGTLARAQGGVYDGCCQAEGDQRATFIVVVFLIFLIIILIIILVLATVIGNEI